MKVLVILYRHLLTTVARLLRLGGARAIAAESVLMKQQLCHRVCPSLSGDTPAATNGEPIISTADFHQFRWQAH